MDDQAQQYPPFPVQPENDNYIGEPTADTQIPVEMPEPAMPVLSTPPEDSFPPEEQLDQDTNSDTTSTRKESFRDRESAIIPGMMKPQKERVLIEWEAPSRPFKKHNRQFYTTIGIVALLIALILFFAGQMLPVAVVLAVAFLFYVLNSTQPGIVTHKITTYGIRVENSLYYWEELGRFWFTKKYDIDLLHIEVARFPNRVTILLGDLYKDDLELVLSEVLLHEAPPLTAYEKGAKWLHEKVPIDIES